MVCDIYGVSCFIISNTTKNRRRREKTDFVACEKQRRRPACAFAQSGQRRFIGYLETCIVSKRPTCQIIYVHVARETGLRIIWLETAKSGFLAVMPK